MKKTLSVFMIVLVLLSLTACGKASQPSSDPATESSAPNVMESTQEKPARTLPLSESSEPTSPVPTQTSEATMPEPDPIPAEPAIDVDLTQLSSTMVYSEVFNMMYAPEGYIGKTVKMKGQLAIYQAVDKDGTPIPDQMYFACVIADATACCLQGVEFVLAGEHTYPDDYPEPGSEITVTGTFEVYEEAGYQYCRLVDAEMIA